ncbi:MAG: acyl-CoA desaturase [Gammaproteobacteria bacterium]
MIQKKIQNGAGLAIVYYHIALLIALPFYFYFDPPSQGMVITTIVLYFLTGISITAGYHRYYSHKTYKMSRIPEFFILYLATMAAQGSVLRWAFEHRLHHAYVDTDNDPYSVKKGFWYAHVLWLMEKPRPIDPKFVKDLLKNKWIVFQDKYYITLLLLTNVPVFLLAGWFFNDFTGAFLLAIWTRVLALHHSTWFINSLAHTWGAQTFSKEHSAVDNFLISFLTFGEGYHSYHHTFAMDYRNGIHWYHFDPTKWLIWGLSKCKLAWDLRKLDTYSIRKRLVMEDKNLLLEQIKHLIYVRKELLEQKILEMSDKIAQQISEFQQLIREYKTQKHLTAAEDLKILKLQIKSMKKTIHREWKNWITLSEQIMHLKPLALSSESAH